MATKKPVSKRKTTAQKRVEREQPKAVATVFRVMCLIGAISLLVLDATIPTFNYPVWLLGGLMGVVIGLGPEDLRNWFKGGGGGN